MHGSFRLIASVLGALMASTSWACPAPSRPKEDSEYKVIAVAEIVGIHLTEYAQARLEQIKEGRAYTWPMDTSPGYDVDVIPFETLKGSTDRTMAIHVSAGCGVPTPDLNQFGIFYVDEAGNAQVVLQDHTEYRDRLEKLGSRYTTTCSTSERFAPHPCWKPRQERLECLSLVKNIAFVTRFSCPAGVQELYEQMKGVTVKQYGWEWPPLRIQ
jgi:hypothetical protein